MAQGYKVPAAAAVRMRVVRQEEGANSRLVAVVRIVVVVHIAAVAAVHIAEVGPATGIHLQEDREIVCSVAFQVGAALGTVSPVVVAGLAQQMRRRQPDVLREACRGLSVAAQSVARGIECASSGPSPELVCGGGCSRGVLRQSANKIKKQSGSGESLPEKGCRLDTKEERLVGAS